MEQFNSEVEAVYKSELFCGMCKRYGRNNHEELKSVVIAILLELSEEKKQEILEFGFLLPYAIQTARFQVSNKNWTAFRKEFGNREQIICYQDLHTHEGLSLQNIPAEEEEEHSLIYGLDIMKQIKKDMRLQTNKYFYHSRLLFEVIDKGISIKQLSRELGIPYTSVIHSIKQYREYLKTWLESAQ
jgi:hypothetical protein